MAISYALHGATTTHGGVINATQTFSKMNNRPYLREGDYFFCPTCKRISKFITGSGDQGFIIYDRAAILNGTMLSCGAKVIDNQLGHVRELEGRKSTSAVQKNYSNEDKKPVNQEIISDYNEQFEIRDQFGNLLSGFDYSVRLLSGEVIHGVSDDQGKTKRYTTPEAQMIEIHVGHI